MFIDSQPSRSRAGIAFLIVMILTLSNCKRQTSSTGEMSSRLSIEAARQISDAVAEDLINQRSRAIRAKGERLLRDQVDDKSFALMLDQMYKAYGTPLECDFKQAEFGTKTYSNSQVKEMWKFWYAVRTTKFEKGDHFLFVEVVKDGSDVAFSSFAIVRFDEGVPANLR